VILVGTIVFWAFVLDALAFRITEEELHSQLRQQGWGDLGQVRAFSRESDGESSVVTGGHHPRSRTPRGV
jgi:uncharacterized membrane protein YcaP (DUF421 family)